MSDPTPRRRTWLRPLLALVPLVLLVALLEVSLALLGLGDAADHLGASRGFDRSADYLLPDPAVPGGWVTNMFDRGSEVTIAPRDDRVRVLLVGGSNTQMFPERELQRLLDAAGGGVRHDVVNLGREGYGSERVAILLSQAVPALRPDVVVVYSGHNEFIEKGFERELEQAGPEPWLAPLAELRTVRWLSALASASRSSGAGAAGVAGHDAPAGPRRPEPWVMAYPEFRELAYADTLGYFDAYEARLREMARVCADGDAAVVFCTPVSNMLTPPWSSRPPDELDAETVRTINRLVGEAEQLLPAVMTEPFTHDRRLRAMEWVPMVPPEMKAFLREAYEPRPLPALRPLTGVLVPGPAGQVKGSRSMAGSHWPEAALWRPKVWELLELMAGFHAWTPDAREREVLLDADARCREVLALAPDHPGAHFQRGVLALKLGDPGTAAEELALAGRFDRAPRSVNDESNARMRRVAVEAGAPVVDAAALFRERSPDRIVGFEIMMDHCHLHPGARKVLMADLVPAIRDAAGR